VATDRSDPEGVAALVREHLTGANCGLKVRGDHLGKPDDGGLIVEGTEARPERLIVTFRGTPFDKVILVGGARRRPPPLLIINCPWDVRVDEHGLRVFDAQLIHMDSGNGGRSAPLDVWRDAADWVMHGFEGDGRITRVSHRVLTATPIFELAVVGYP